MKRQITLPAAIFIIIGYVVGATIFVLPGQLTAVAGPAVFLAYLLAAIPAIFYGFVVAQTGSAYPVSGGGYLLIKDALSPFLGFIYLWIIISLAVVAVPLIALGFSQYLSSMVAGIDVTWTAVAIIAVFVVANCFGAAVAGVAQNIMVVLFLGALILFSGTGIVHGDVGYLQPLLPFGYQGVFLAMITASFSYAGVLVVAEIAGEIKNPGRNIPLAILISFSVIIALYSLVPLALNMMVPWQDLSKMQAPVIEAAKKFLDAGWVQFIWGGALFAAATSVNSILMGLSRDLYQGAREGLFHGCFAQSYSKKETPIAAIVGIGALSVAGVLFGGNILQYAEVAIVGVMLTQILMSFAVIRLPQKLPQKYEQSHYKLKPKSILFFASISSLMSLGFLIVLLLQDLMLGLALGLYIGIGSLYYFRPRKFKRS